VNTERHVGIERRRSRLAAAFGSPRWTNRLIPAAVLLIGIVLSLFASRSAREETRRDALDRLDITAANAAVQVERRFSAYFSVLAGTRALFHTVDRVSREDFHRYAQALTLKSDFPGFNLLNYAPYVAPGSEGAFEKAMRSDPSLPPGVRFAINPQGVRDGYHPLTLLEPFEENRQVLGKDLAAVPGVRRVMDQARDTGKMTSSGMVLRPQGLNSRAALAVRLPVYRVGMPVDTIEQRRAAYLGSVGAGIWLAEMLAGLPGVPEGARLRLFDGGPESAATHEPGAATVAPPPDKLLFDTDSPDGGRPSAKRREGGANGDVQSARSFGLGGRLWVVEVSAPVAGDVGQLERMMPVIIVVAGGVISALLAGVLFSLISSRRRATELAHDMTQSLRTSQQRLAEAQELAKLGSWVLDPQTGAVECSDEARRIYGLTETAVTPTLSRLLALIPEAQRTGLREAVDRAEHDDATVELEHLVHEPDGTKRWVRVNLQGSAQDGVVTVRATVRDETTRKNAALRLELAHDIARELAGDATPESAVAYILTAIGTQLGWHAAVCWMVDDDALVRCMGTWATEGDAASQEFIAAMRDFSGPRQGGNLDAAWACANPLWRAIPAASAARGWQRDRVAGRCGLQAAVVIPVIAGTQLVALEFFNRTPIGIDREIEGFMRSIASQLAQYLQRRQAETALRHVASHDALTGLANRPLLHERLTHAIQRAARQQTRVAVLFMDLDRFKHINDSLGHSAGDVLLRACADRLRESVRESDTVARFGGDEFVLILEGLNSAADVIAPLTKVLGRFSLPFEVNGHELPTTASIGISVFPEDGADVETLLMNADAAMYRAKERGPGNHHFYSAQMNTRSQERLALQSCLPRALERGELFLVYQPKLDLASGRVTGVEALMRWRHPSMGLISPLQFIPIAEETGLIDSFGHWALEVACRDARKWQDQGHPAQVSVNLSARQLDRPELAAEVANVIAAARIDAGQLELEITESGVMRNPIQAAARLQELRDLGVSLAIDDFGTGYSSLSYLRTFPLSTLKIDRSFIKDLPADEDAAALTAGIIGLAHRLRMKVVAEGVETLEQLGYLRANGCDEIQGYYLSKPIGADEMGRFLERDLRNLVSPAAVA
jgi:diguanylate cyclase (GGDEF)-like protein/PAS domain S-box-containing protein